MQQTFLPDLSRLQLRCGISSKKSPHVKIGRIRIDGELLPQVLSVGVSALLMQILTLVQQTVIYRVASNYGGETSQLL